LIGYHSMLFLKNDLVDDLGVEAREAIPEGGFNVEEGVSCGFCVADDGGGPGICR
jgi:hypothetical protein